MLKLPTMFKTKLTNNVKTKITNYNFSKSV